MRASGEKSNIPIDVRIQSVFKKNTSVIAGMIQIEPTYYTLNPNGMYYLMQLAISMSNL